MNQNVPQYLFAGWATARVIILNFRIEDSRSVATSHSINANVRSWFKEYVRKID
jgi:phage-related holin